MGTLLRKCYWGGCCVSERLLVFKVLKGDFRIPFSCFPSCFPKYLLNPFLLVHLIHPLCIAVWEKDKHILTNGY